MRLEKKIKIGDCEVIVKELRAKDIYNAKLWFESVDFLANIMVADFETMKHIFETCVEIKDGSLELLIEGANSYAKIVETFREVNRDFLSLLPNQVARLAGK